MVIHLHWAWAKGPSAARGVTVGMALCGTRVPASEFTSFREDTTCPKCLARVERGDTTVPDGIGPAPPKKDKTRTSMLRRAAKKGDPK